MVNIKNSKIINRGPIGPMIAGVAGAAIGASAVALSDKKVRRQVGKVLEKAVGQVQDKVYMQVKELRKRVRNAIEQSKTKKNTRLAVHATR